MMIETLADAQMAQSNISIETLTDAQKLNQQWVDACSSALDECPPSFFVKFTEIMFLGQRLITESRVTAGIEAHMTALNTLPRA